MDRRVWLNDQQEAYQTAFEYFQSMMWTALPAIVIGVNLEKQTISAQCSIKGEFKNKKGIVSYIDMKPWDDIVMCLPRAGGYALTFPVKVGDEVLVLFASRCIDGWWQSGGENNISPEFRMHDLSDSFAILAPTSQPKRLSNISEDGVRLTNEDGTKYIEISDEKITVQSDGDVEVNAENVRVEASEDVEVIAKNVTVEASEHINLNASIAVNITAPDIFLNGIVHP